MKKNGRICSCSNLRSNAGAFITAGILSALSCAPSMHAQITYPSSGDIDTIAGNGNFGYSGDNGYATYAEFRDPEGVAFDGAGNVFIADESNNVIREISANSGVITTIAGNGSAGYSGDGGPATQAQLSGPSGLAVDFAGNLFIADCSNHAIREVTFSSARQVRVISTVAGNGTIGYSGDNGPATNAQLAFPCAVAVDLADNVYIADEVKSVIRKVSATTGIITTVAGNGTFGYSGDGGSAIYAQLHYPMGVAVDTSGNIYIADTYNARVRMVNASSGIISTIAGGASGYYSGDGGPATQAALSEPWDVAVDRGGNIYIADLTDRVIRMVNASTGIISRFAGDGTGTGGYSGDGGPANLAVMASPLRVAVDGNGHTIIADLYGWVRAVTGTPPPQPPPPAGQPATPYESNATVTVNGTNQTGPAVSTNYLAAMATTTAWDGTIVVCEVSCSGISTNVPAIPASNTGASGFTIGYVLTVQDATPGAMIEYNILENGVSHSGSVPAGGTISFSVPGGTTLSGNMVAVVNGIRSPTTFLGF